MKNSLLSYLLIILFLTSCSKNTPKNSITGLWIVETVTMGKKEMTPNARWMRFHKDLTQESGNGWFQHSIGTYKINNESKELSIKNSNGINDNNPPFVIEINGEKMTWKRTEDGQPLVVNLKRANELPTTYGDQLLGLWKLNSFKGKGDFFENENGFLFFRWDKRFNINSSLGKFSGVYNAHGHKSEVELIPYGNNLKRSFWKVDFKENQISLKLLNSDSIVTRSFIRIHDFPN